MTNQQARKRSATVPADSDARQRLLAGAPVTQRRQELAGVSTVLLSGGDGKPIVLLHGQGAFAGVWLPLLAGLTSTHQVIAPDLPGLGASTVADEPPGTDLVLRWLGELIGRTCTEPPVLVGFSLGGQIAARYAAEHGDRIARLVLVDTPGLVGKPRLRPSTLFSLVRHSIRPTKHSNARLLRHLVVDPDRLRTRLGEQWDPFVTYQLDRARTQSVQRANRRLMREIGLQQVPTEQLDRISVPTALVWGRQDRIAPVSTAEEAAERYGWPLQVVDAGHLAIVEQPGAVLRALHDLIER